MYPASPSVPEAATFIVFIPQLLIGTSQASVPAAPVPSEMGFRGIYILCLMILYMTEIDNYIFLDLTVVQSMVESATTSVAVHGAVQSGVTKLVTVSSPQTKKFEKSTPL